MATKLPFSELRRRGAAVVLFAGTILATTFRGFRTPNDWAEAHWFFDYSFGFQRRALVGTVYTLLREVTGQVPTASAIAAISTTILVLTCCAFFAASIYIVQRAEWSTEAILVVACFLGSPFFVIVGYFNGYYDHIFFLLGFVSFVLAFKERWIAAGMVQGVAVLVHETSVLLLWPSFVLAAFVAGTVPGARSLRTDRRRLIALALPVLVFLALLVLPKIDFQANFEARLSAFSFIRRGRHALVPELLAKSFFAYYQTEFRYFGEHLWKVSMLLRVLPLVYLFFAWILLRGRFALRSPEMLLIFVATFAAQSLHTIAWDTERIWLYALVGAFFCALIVSVYRPFVAFADKRLRHIALGIFLANAFTQIFLMDGDFEALGPFARVAIYVPLFVLMVWLATCDYSKSDGRVATNVRSP